MYMLGQGHPHYGPGTAMVQFSKPVAGYGMTGLGCRCANGGMGCACKGMGLFDAGVDFTQWGMAEWAIVGIAGYALLSTVFTTQRGAQRVRKSFRKYARRRAVSV
jgi:hypothetical protein